MTRATCVLDPGSQEGFVERNFGMARLSKSWRRLQLSKKRQDAGCAWLDWGTDEMELQGEPSMVALQKNTPMVQVMFEEFQSLEPPNVQTVMKQALCPDFVDL